MTQSMTTGKTIGAFLAFYAVCFIVQYSGSQFTMMSVHDWYPSLNKSQLTPPGYAFGVAWSILYVLMALAATRIYRITGRMNSRPTRWWLIQLLVGWVWTIVFFGHQEIEYGLITIIAGWVAVLITFLAFRRVNHKAGWLMFPLLLWITFATYLNGYIAYAN